MGILSAAMFFVLSNSKPLDKLSKQRPHPNIWSVYVFASLLGQFLVHVTFLAWCYSSAKAAMPPVGPHLPLRTCSLRLSPQRCHLCLLLCVCVCCYVRLILPSMTLLSSSPGRNGIGKPCRSPLSTSHAHTSRHSIFMNPNRHITNAGVARDLQGEALKPDSEFKPNLVNTVCFLVNWVIQITTFSVNYVGHPFNTALQDNKGLFGCIKCAPLLAQCQGGSPPPPPSSFLGAHHFLAIQPLPHPSFRSVLCSRASLAAL